MRLRWDVYGYLVIHNEGVEGGVNDRKETISTGRDTKKKRKGCERKKTERSTHRE